MAHLCPHCRVEKLAPGQLKGVSLMACPACEGLWFESRALEKYLEVAAKNLSLPEDAEIKGRVCPECVIHMHQFYYPQTYCAVDMCGRCKGVWLDHKEIEEIKVVRNALKKKGELEKVAPPSGIKGSIIGFVNSTLDQLMDFS